GERYPVQTASAYFLLQETPINKSPHHVVRNHRSEENRVTDSISSFKELFDKPPSPCDAYDVHHEEKQDSPHNSILATISIDLRTWDPLRRQIIFNRFADVLQSLLFVFALRPATRSSRTTDGKTFVGWNENNAKSHNFISPRFFRSPTAGSRQSP
ncbi:MAG: hypothetical protein KY445_16390, partial [Armatimonadetes bacterium]|nr:hypothetical protein [Armatimonadota bacterium]